MLRTMGVAKRFIAVFCILGVITLSISLIGLYEANIMRKSSNEIDKVWLPSIMLINDIDRDFLGIRIITLNIAANRSIESLPEEIKRFNALKQKLDNHKHQYEKIISSTNERLLYDRLETAFNKYFDQQRQIVNLVGQRQFDEAKLVSQGEVRTLALDVSSLLEELINLNRQNATAASNFLDEAYSEAIMASILGLTLALLISAILAVLLTQSIVNPLFQAVQVAESIAAGDLTQPIIIEGQDEPARLLQALRGMQRNLGDTVTQIMNSSLQLAAASEELTAVAGDTNRNLQQQNIEIEQAVTAVNEMATAVDEVARNALSTSEASKESDQKAKLGRDQVVKAVTSINTLASDVTDTSQQVERLAEEVRNISQVLDVIRAIAEQTNLLALNAAIEAARAGDAGRGFAVVADEVRALAHRTQQSTQEIEQMIGSIHSGTDQAVGSMQSSNTRAKSTLEVAERAGQALEEITLAIEQINEKNLLIASASEEQAHVAREVDRNLVNIRDLSVQSSAGANQTMSASRELSVLANKLSGLVQQFKV